MEIISEPAFIEEQVTDLDVVFVGGLRDSLTLRPGDELTFCTNTVEAKVKYPPELIVMNRSNILSHRIRQRTIRKPVTEAPTPQPPIAPDGTNLAGV